MPNTYDSLALFGIEVKNVTKAGAIIRLKDKSEDDKMSRKLFDILNESADTHANIKIQKDFTNFKFGVEFEFVGSANPIDLGLFTQHMQKLTGGKFVNAGKYAHNDGSMWILGKDSSIKYDESSIGFPTGYELSTPALNWNDEDDIATLLAVIDSIKSYLRGEVNLSCGTHIHLGYTPDKVFKNNIRAVLDTYAYIERKVFDPIVPISRRKNKYCRQTTSYLNEKYQKVSSRYCKFDSLNECKCLHFEFRQLEGTLDGELLLNWITLHSTIMSDLISHSNDDDYLESLFYKNIFDLLFYYDFDSTMISYFIDRVIKFKSKSIQY